MQKTIQALVLVMLCASAGPLMAQQRSPSDAETARWNQTRFSRFADDYVAFIRDNPRSPYVADAQRRLADLEAGQPAAAAAAAAPPASVSAPAISGASAEVDAAEAAKRRAMARAAIEKQIQDLKHRATVLTPPNSNGVVRQKVFDPTLASTRPLTMSPEFVMLLQQRFYDLNEGKVRPTGKLDEETKRAIARTQLALRQPNTGILTEGQWAAMQRIPVPKLWGAIGYSSRGTHVVTSNHPTRQSAETAIAKSCEGTCTIRAVHDEHCAAYVFAKFQEGNTIHHNSYLGGGRSDAEAKKSALDLCAASIAKPKSCTPQAWACAASQHPPARPAKAATEAGAKPKTSPTTAKKRAVE